MSKPKLVLSDRLYTEREVYELLRAYAAFLGQRDGQHLPTIAPLEGWFIKNKK